MRFQIWGKKKPRRKIVNRPPVRKASKRWSLKTWIKSKLDWRLPVWTFVALGLKALFIHAWLTQVTAVQATTQSRYIQTKVEVEILREEIQKGFAELKARPTRQARSKSSWAPFQK